MNAKAKKNPLIAPSLNKASLLRNEKIKKDLKNDPEVIISSVVVYFHLDFPTVSSAQRTNSGVEIPKTTKN